MIGLFDSGYGGLSILSELTAQLPHYRYLYLGDNANAPYGARSAPSIEQLTIKGVDHLFQQGCQLVILACNTASAVALRSIQQNWLPHHYPDRRILGIVVPTVEQITGANWQHTEPISTPISDQLFTIGILATNSTVASNLYPKEIHRRNPSVKVIQQACPELTSLIEQGAEPAAMMASVSRYLIQLQQKISHSELQAILLGCTHYAFIADLIRAQLPTNMRFYQQPTIVAASLTQYLARHPGLVQPARSLQVTYLTTGDTDLVSTQASHLLRHNIKFQQAAI